MVKREGAWLVGATDIGDGQATLKFDAQIVEPLPDYEWEVLIALQLRRSTPAGLSASEDGAQLNTIQDHIRDAAGDDAYLVAVITSSGFSKVLLYARDTAWLERWQHAQQASGDPRAASITSKVDPDWAMYYVLFPLAEMAHADLGVYRKLVEAGSRLDKARNVNWLLRFPDEGSARTVATMMRRWGFDTAVRRDGDGEWLVEAHMLAVVHLREIAFASVRLRSLASAHGGSYDGWGADVSP